MYSVKRTGEELESERGNEAEGGSGPPVCEFLHMKSATVVDLHVNVFFFCNIVKKTSGGQHLPAQLLTEMNSR